MVVVLVLRFFNGDQLPCKVKAPAHSLPAKNKLIKDKRPIVAHYNALQAPFLKS